MQLTFTMTEKFQLQSLINYIAENKEVKMSNKDAKVFTEILKRLTSSKRTNKWKREYVESLRWIVHQVLEHREENQEEMMKGMDEVERNYFGMENNTFLLIMDKLNQKLGEAKRTIDEIEGKEI